MPRVSLAHPVLQQFLAAKSVAVLATVQPSGAPLAMPMWFVHDAHAITMISEAGLQKVHNLRRDPRACVTVEGEVCGTIAGAIVQGQACFLDAAEQRTAYVDALHAKYGVSLAERVSAWGLAGL